MVSIREFIRYDEQQQLSQDRVLEGHIWQALLPPLPGTILEFNVIAVESLHPNIKVFLGDTQLGNW